MRNRVQSHAFPESFPLLSSFFQDFRKGHAASWTPGHFPEETSIYETTTDWRRKETRTTHSRFSTFSHRAGYCRSVRLGGGDAGPHAGNLYFERLHEPPRGVNGFRFGRKLRGHEYPGGSERKYRHGAE